MSHEVMKPCRMCNFPTDEATLWVNYRFSGSMICNSCHRKYNRAKRAAYKHSSEVNLNGESNNSPSDRVDS